MGAYSWVNDFVVNAQLKTDQVPSLETDNY